MDTKAVESREITFVVFDEATDLDLEFLDELKLEDHEEESFDPRNRNGSCLNS